MLNENSKEEEFEKGIKRRILMRLPKEDLVGLIFELEEDKKSLKEKIDKLESED
jgi:hypothetical protein